MKKIKVLALIMVFALTALGGAYAMWYDSLYIDETVTTGIVNLQWCGDTFSSDPSPNYEGSGGVFEGNLDRLDPGNPNDAKNVAYKDVVISNDSEELPAIEGTDTRMVNDLMTINLYNGYPGYQAYIYSAIWNKGTVPTKFEVSLAEGTIPDWLHFQIVKIDGTVLFDNLNEIELLEGMQIDPNGGVCVIIKERVLQEAPQNATANFTMQLKGIQWNEYNFDLPNVITADTAGY